MLFRPASNAVTVNSTFTNTIFDASTVYVYNPDAGVKAISIPGSNTGNIILRSNSTLVLRKEPSVNVVSNGVVHCTKLGNGA